MPPAGYRVVERRMLDGRIVGLRIDITGANAGQRSRRSRVQVQEQILASMSHEIRTPTNAILSMRDSRSAPAFSQRRERASASARRHKRRA